jgi:hypothetical protein
MTTNEGRACSMTREQWIIENRRQKIAERKQAIYMFCHKVFWRTLHFTMLAGPYSRFMCWRGWYRKFPDGRCHWCGEIHK